MHIPELVFDHFPPPTPLDPSPDSALVDTAVTPTSSFDGANAQSSGSTSSPDHPRSYSPGSTHNLPGLSLPKPKRGRPPASGRRPESSPDPDTLIKRQRNNIAAKKYRQKKIDRIQELEDEVDNVKRERDDLRIQLARQEAETAALREMLKMATAGRMMGSS